ncbi:26141_t:CDS:2 [Gigaspora margarita]|uniref:26141_t:CDS:1 n=1 Tax=Gigaspora margarita TaxID=4874 RepID=A0ABM8W5G4_GIGMA|nr:26141_t:CDS:2 [Gigaspora margarita]
MKGDNLNQPNPEVSTYTDSNSQWIIPIPLSSPNSSRLMKNMIKKESNQKGIQYNDKQVNSELVTILRANIQSETQNRIEGWALKEMQEIIKKLFHAGDIDKSEQYTAKDMLDALEKKAEVGELETSDVPKLKTIENWIRRYA